MGRRFALLIGTTRYDDARFLHLKAPNADIRGLAAALKDPKVCAFDRVDVLLDEVFAEVQVAVSRFFSEGKKDDLLLLYFSGHGIVDDAGRLYLCLKNSSKDLIRATALRAAALSDEIDMCRSERQVLILDCCHAGAFVRGAKGATGIGDSVGTMSVFEGTGKGRVVLTATDATQFAFEGDQVIGESANASLFTHFLIEGLNTGLSDSDGDGQITVDELFTYAYQRVTQAAPQQTPGKWAYKQQGDIVLARNPCPVALKNLIDPGLVEAAAAGKPLSVREASVRSLSRYLSDSRPGVVLAARDVLSALIEDDSRTIAALAQSVLDMNGRPDVPSLQATTFEPRHTPVVPPSGAPPAPSGNAFKRVAVATASVTALLAVLAGVSWHLQSRATSPPPPAPSPHAVALPTIPIPPAPPPATVALSSVPTAVPPAPGPHLQIERGEDLPGAKIYVVRANGTSEELKTFPATVLVDSAAPVSIEGYWGKKHLVQQVSLKQHESERVVRIDSGSLWRNGSSAGSVSDQGASASTPVPSPATVSLRGSTITGHMDEAELTAGLRQVKASFLRCPTSGVQGQATFRAGVEPDGAISTFLQSTSGALPKELTSCFAKQAKGARFPSGRTEAVVVNIVTTLR